MTTLIDLYVDRGTDYSTRITAKTSNQTPVDLTDCVVMSQMKRYYDSTAVHNIESQIIGDPAAGVVELSLSANTTLELHAGRWVYDVIAHNTSTNTITRIIEGLVVINPHVTTITP